MRVPAQIGSVSARKQDSRAEMPVASSQIRSEVNASVYVLHPDREGYVDAIELDDKTTHNDVKCSLVSVLSHCEYAIEP